MPINIYIQDTLKNIAFFCENEWDLPSQIDDLAKWLAKNHSNLTLGPYVADIGFSMRKDASGGGAVVSLKMMELMLKASVELFLSEYPENEEN